MGIGLRVCQWRDSEIEWCRKVAWEVVTCVPRSVGGTTDCVLIECRANTLSYRTRLCNFGTYFYFEVRRQPSKTKGKIGIHFCNSIYDL